MDLASFAELAVRLVDSAVSGTESDPLRSGKAFRELVADHPSLGGAVHQHDLDRLKLLRVELAAIFGLSSAGAEAECVSRLNDLLMIHPVLPALTCHDGEPWHLHLSGSGSVADRYGAAAVFGLTTVISRRGLDGLGNCPEPGCRRVFAAASNDRSARYCGEHRIQEFSSRFSPRDAPRALSG